MSVIMGRYWKVSDNFANALPIWRREAVDGTDDIFVIFRKGKWRGWVFTTDVDDLSDKTVAAWSPKTLSEDESPQPYPGPGLHVPY